MTDTTKLELPLWSSMKTTHKKFMQDFTDYLDACEASDVLDIANKPSASGAVWPVTSSAARVSLRG